MLTYNSITKLSVGIEAIITFLKGAANTLDPNSNSKISPGIQDAPILTFEFAAHPHFLSSRTGSIGTQPTIVGKCSYCQQQCSYSEKGGRSTLLENITRSPA